MESLVQNGILLVLGIGAVLMLLRGARGGHGGCCGGGGHCGKDGDDQPADLMRNNTSADASGHQHH